MNEKLKNIPFTAIMIIFLTFEICANYKKLWLFSYVVLNSVAGWVSNGYVCGYLEILFYSMYNSDVIPK